MSGPADDTPRAPGTAGAPGDEVDAAVERTVERLRQYVAMARGLAGEHPDPAEAAHDPRLDDAQRSLATAMGALCDAYVDTFGHVPSLAPTWPAEPGSEAGDDDAEALAEVEVFGLRLLVGLDPDAPEPRPGVTSRDDEDFGDDPYGVAFRLVDDAGFALTQQLEDAGYLVPSFVSSRGAGVDEDPFAEDLPADDEGDEP